MNASMRNVDRGTHLKIVVSALICAAIVVGIGIAARVSPANGRIEETSAGKPVTDATIDSTSISRGFLQPRL
jgi:hypothetical protein